MRQEQQPKRQDKIDLRVHACLYFIRPTGHTLRPLDIEVMKRLGSRVNLIPVIAKADTLSPSDLRLFKERIRKVIAAQGIKVFTPPIDEDDRQAADHARDLTAAMPFAVIGSDKDVQTPEGKVVKGRLYLWGVAEVENVKGNAVVPKARKAVLVEGQRKASEAAKDLRAAFAATSPLIRWFSNTNWTKLRRRSRRLPRLIRS